MKFLDKAAGEHYEKCCRRKSKEYMSIQANALIQEGKKNTQLHLGHGNIF